MGDKHSVDIHVGMMIRKRRRVLGISQQVLAESVGIRFQQVQKYETGTNRVSASRLFDMANALAVPVSYFFEGIDGPAASAGCAAPVPADFLADECLLDLVRAYYSIPKANRRRLFDLARDLSDAA
ncbi:MAG: helix-turn-helix domain-containing protein [Qingshengfaniella sp.]